MSATSHKLRRVNSWRSGPACLRRRRRRDECSRQPLLDQRDPVALLDGIRHQGLPHAFTDRSPLEQEAGVRAGCAVGTADPAMPLRRLLRSGLWLRGPNLAWCRADRAVTERRPPPIAHAACHMESIPRLRTLVRNVRNLELAKARLDPGAVCMLALCITALSPHMPEATQSRVGEQLRRIRESAGLSGSAVARELGWSQSKVSRVETGRFGASLEEVAQLLDYYGVPEEVRAEILASVARHEGMEGAWVVRAGGSPRRQAEVATVESRVVGLSQYQALWFPGLLQSADYAAAIAKSGGFGPQGAFVERRQQRQQTLRARADVSYRVVLEEQALALSPGAGSVMATQLDHVLEAMDQGFVDLRIRPQDATNAVFASSSFVIYDFASGPPVVLAEAQTADLYLSAEGDVAAYRELFTRLQKNALGRKESRAAVESARRRVAS